MPPRAKGDPFGSAPVHGPPLTLLEPAAQVTSTSKVSGGLSLPAASVATHVTDVVPRGNRVAPSAGTAALSIRVLQDTVAPGALSLAATAGQPAPSAVALAPRSAAACSGVAAANTIVGGTASGGGGRGASARARGAWGTGRTGATGGHFKRPQVVRRARP
jgi:hypothetical protein